ncbi:MAG TPA: hypothetical protein DD414_07645, partial [Lachnospiraceae bacterium]|nr:hypothetical protein [Lachnospiraceae bacterium]
MKKRYSRIIAWLLSVMLCLCDVLPTFATEAEETNGSELILIEEDELEHVYQFGDAPTERGAIVYAGEGNSTDGIEDYLYAQMKERNPKIDISDYGIKYDTAGIDLLRNIFSGVLNEHPDLYFVGKKYSYSRTDQAIVQVMFTYNDSLKEEDFQTGVDKALAAVNEGMSPLEKAIVLHDYLAVNCEYDKERLADGTIPDTSYTAYGVLVDRIAVCEGYALAYKYLLNQAGINCYMVTSTTMKHGWNLIELDGEYYHVDVTWDDPTWDLVGRACHSYMFRSDDTFKAMEHEDWSVTKGSYAVDYEATSTRYDNAFWIDSTAPLVLAEGSCYYVSSDRTIKKASLTEFTEVGEKVCDIGIWKTWDDNGSWQGTYSGLFLNDGRLYYNDPTSICSISLDGRDKRTEFTADTSNGYIYGSAYYQGKVWYSLHQTPNPEQKETVLDSGIDFESDLPPVIPVEQILLDKTSLTLAEGDTVILQASVLPADAAERAVIWSSSDEQTATVEAGTVTAVAAGDCTITASAGGKSAVCNVVVSKQETPAEEPKTIQIGETVTLEGDGPWTFYFTPEEDGEYFLYEIESEEVIYGDCYRLSDDEFISEYLDMYPLTAGETYYIEIGLWGGSQGDSLKMAKRVKNVIEVGETVRLEGPAPNWRYYFTPSEDGNYYYEYSGSVDACWYRVSAEDKLHRMGYDNGYDLAAGTEYCLMMDQYDSSRNSVFKVVKNQKYEITPGETIELGDIYAGRCYYFTVAENGVYNFESDSTELNVVDVLWYKVSNGERTRLSSVEGICELEAETEYCVCFGSGMEGHSVRLVMNEKLSPVRRMVAERTEEITAGGSRYFRLDFDPEKIYYLGLPSNWCDFDEEECSIWKYSEYLDYWNTVIHEGICWFVLKNYDAGPAYLLINSAPEDAAIYLTESPSFSETMTDWSGSLTLLAGEQKYLTLAGKTAPGDYLVSLDSQTDWNVISKKDFSYEEATLEGQDYFVLSDKGREGSVTFYLENTGQEDVELSLSRETEFKPTVITAGAEYKNPSRYLSFTSPNTGFYKIAQRQYALRWIYKKSDNSAVKYAPDDEYISLEGGAEYLLCWSGDIFSIMEEKPDIVEASGKALEMEADTYYAFTPSETGVYVADPNPNKVTCWCGCEEGKWTRDEDTGHFGHQMEAGKVYYIKPVSDDVRISLKRNITILDYDYYNAFIASGGAVSMDGTITDGNAGWSLKSVACVLYDFIKDGIADLSKLAGGNQYWKTDNEGSFKVDKIYGLKDPKTQMENPDDIKDKDVLLVEYRPEIVWVQSIDLKADKTSLKTGESIQIEAKLDKGQDKYDFTAVPVLRWESSDNTVAAVDENGKVTANQAGNATITVYADEALRKQEGLSNIVKASIDFSVTGDAEPDTTTCTITFDLQGRGTALPEYAQYTGIEKGSTVRKPADPEADGYAFTGWHKEASCQNLWDFEKDTVEADMTLYAGWVSESDYEGVLPGDAPAIGNRDGIWIAAIKDQMYTGKAIKPKVHVYSQEQRLKEGWDYTLTYKNNIKVSASKAPQVIVKCKGNYTGTYKASFKIVRTGLNESHLLYAPVYPKGKAYTPVIV